MSPRTLVALLAILTLGLAACDATDETAAPDDDTAVSDDGTATDEQDAPIVEVTDEVTRGSFSGVAMVHQTTYEGAAVEEETDAWDGTMEPGGPYSYASIPCNENAPVNNISTDLVTFNTQIEGSRVPASTRNQPIEFEVVEGEDGELRLEGTIALTVCQLRPGVTPDPDPVPDSEKYQIDFEWSADVHVTTDEQITWRGDFQIVGGTGIYEELTGEGTIAGYFLCFAPEGCEGIGEFADAQYSMIGTYEIPTEVVEGAQAPLYGDEQADEDGQPEEDEMADGAEDDAAADGGE